MRAEVDLGREARVHLDEVHSHEAARQVHALADVVALAQCKAATNGRTCAGRPHRVERVDVEG